MKRKAEDELGPHSAKRSPSASLTMNMSNSRSGGSNSPAQAQETVGEAGRGRTETNKATARPTSLGSTTEVKVPKRRLAATKEISPPPLRRSVAIGREVTTVQYRSAIANMYMLASISSTTQSKFMMTYPNGALRITRTPGRGKTKNCVNLQDVIHKQHLISACVFSFFISEPEFFAHLPLSDSSNAVPVSESNRPSRSGKLTS